MKGRSFEENADDLNTKKRRKIREKQKSLYDDIHTAKVNLSSVESKSFQDFRGKLNDIFVEVDHPREQQSDAVSFKVLSMSAKQQSSNMLDSSFQFNFQSLATKVSEKFSHKGVFSWTNFGKSVQHLDQSRVPEFSCMLGPMNKGEKLRKQMTKKNKEDMNDIVTEIPEEIFQEDQDGDEATNERLKVLYDLFATKITNTAKGGKEYPVFDMLRLLVDPSDRVQTIENFFDFSFLIKDKLVMQDILPGTCLPVACGVDSNKYEEADKKQMILSINMEDLSNFSKLLFPNYQSSSSGELHPLHRSDPLYDAIDASEQADILLSQAFDRRAQKLRKSTSDV